MNTKSRRSLTLLGMTLALAIGLLLPGEAAAHCDTLDGPVVADARTALAQGNVAPVLKWVSLGDEKEIRTAFAKTTAVRKLSPEAETLADLYFFETLVRIHRAGEGAPYTGLKAAGTVEPVIAKADLALEKGAVDELVKAILRHTEEGIRKRFIHALETKKHADESIAAGRKYVEAYVTFVHYVEGIAQVVHAAPHHAEATPQAPHQH
ncbi:hypothetical protein DSOUD_1373 [Desulfuromonas soudanensis]|uniref:Uncharacterized protein n=1 Tax=Desulfuromonas soudanensis TaxID=1603606 RepID=A0A0M3QFJ0_9BACT|nr:DUF6448 family protein [Desulfuromonas soudanensis]ALC16153.1 hypothetical protein DSOUD_1373 [Desulfuromonas soudanensis]